MHCCSQPFTVGATRIDGQVSIFGTSTFGSVSIPPVPKVVLDSITPFVCSLLSLVLSIILLQRSITSLCIAQGFAHRSSVCPVVTSSFTRAIAFVLSESDRSRRNVIELIMCLPSCLSPAVLLARSWSKGPAAADIRIASVFVTSNSLASNLCSSSALVRAAAMSHFFCEFVCL